MESFARNPLKGEGVPWKNDGEEEKRMNAPRNKKPSPKRGLCPVIWF
jgi:hypothetical protein